jgi:hydroxymethylbilane synthase
MSTTGDRQSQWNLAEKGGKGLFTKELEDALLKGDADLAVHSAKDMPTDSPKGLCISTFLDREDPRDVLVLKEGIQSPKVMATGSPRRQSQLQNHFKGCQWIQLRGNVETRLKKIADQDLADGTILAAAGLKRLGLNSFPGLSFTPIPVKEMVPAPGQGAIAIQSRVEDSGEFSRIGDTKTQREVEVEREVLVSRGGGCQVALGVCLQEETLYFFEDQFGSHSFPCEGMTSKEIMKKVGGFVLK